MQIEPKLRVQSISFVADGVINSFKTLLIVAYFGAKIKKKYYPESQVVGVCDILSKNGFFELQLIGIP